MYRTDMHIYIDNLTYSDNTVKHRLSDIMDYVTQYRFQGGPEQPLRYLEMKVDKNDIDRAHPHLIDTIVEGKTRLLINAVDGGTFIITKIWLTENSYDLVATGIEVTLNTATLSEDDISEIGNDTDPPTVVKAIFTRWIQTLNLSTNDTSDYEADSPIYPDDFRIYYSDSYGVTSIDSDGIETSEPRQTAVNQIGFKEDMPTMVAINMCALTDNAFVFFADRDWAVGKDENNKIIKKKLNTLYYVSYEDIYPLAYNPSDPEKNGVVNTYPGLKSQYVNYTKFDLMMYQRVMGVSSKNSEGSETIVNNQIVAMEGGKGSASNQASIEMYGDYAGTKVSSDLMISYDYDDSSTAQLIAEHLVERYKDPTRSITFTLSEVVNDPATGTAGWEGQISPFSYANKIYDSVNKITLGTTHLCDGETNNFLLRLSTFIRAYPEMTTDYTFGVMKETTLSQELANKLTGMSGDVTDIRYNGETITDENGIADLKKMMNYIYPKGAIYTSTSNVSPQTLFGGTWVSFGAGKVLVGQDANDSDFSTVESTGGSKTVALDDAKYLPSHNHSFSGSVSQYSKDSQVPVYGRDDWGYNTAPGWNESGTWLSTRATNSLGGSGSDDTMYVNVRFNHSHTVSGTIGNTGSAEGHQNLQPYIVVYMWKRTGLWSA